MDAFFDDLKKAREAQNISLAEISTATLIDLKMLEALERGNVKVLPQAYIRAFLREYAGIVGLNPQETLKKYDLWLKNTEGIPATAPRPQKEAVAEPAKPESREEKKKFFFSIDTFGPTFFKIAAVLVALILVELVLWNVLQNESPPPVEETSFKEVVKEQEQKAGMSDSIVVPAITAERSAEDTLTLVATTTDSVWLQIIVDEKPLVQHFLLPNTTFSWKGKKTFRLPAIGNPGHLKLTLQGKRVQIPTKNKKVARDMFYSLDSIRRYARRIR